MTASRALVALLYAAFMAAVIVLAVVALVPRRTPILVTGDRYPTDVVARVRDVQGQLSHIAAGLEMSTDAEGADANRQEVEDAKIERELAAIRASLDHITVRVHLGAGCGASCGGGAR